jgi:cytochrome c oxidase cbb3-type subunit I
VGGSRLFTLMAVLFVTVGVYLTALKGLGVLPEMFGPSNLNWIRVHVLTIGTITQVIFGHLPGIFARKLNVPGRNLRETWLQWGLLNGGFILIVVGILGIDPWTASIGATLVFAAVWRLLAGLLRMWTESGRQLRTSARFFLTAPLYLLTGITMAVSMQFNWWSPGGRVGTLEAHVHANVWGFLALVVAGMLFDLFPAVVQAPMAKPGWISRTYWLLNLGALGLVIGPWVNVHVMTVGGLLVYFVGTLSLLANMVCTLRSAGRVPPAAVQMLVSYLWMIVPAFFAPFIVLAPSTVNGPAIEAAATQGLVNGWVLGMIMGAFPRLIRTRPWRSDSALFTGAGDDDSRDGSWVSVVALNLGVALVWGPAIFDQPGPTRWLTLLGYGFIVIAWLPFLTTVWKHFTAQAQEA